MTMPGFEFYFACDECKTKSQSYPTYVFNDLVFGDIVLPAWSIEYKCWADVHLDLSRSQRKELESNRNSLITFAKSLSSPSMTVAAPFMYYEQEQTDIRVEVVPEPQCPHCQTSCRAVFGNPGRAHAAVIEFECADTFDKTYIFDYPFSLGTLNILKSLDLVKLGQLELGMSNIEAHKSTRRTTLKEIRKCLARRP